MRLLSIRHSETVDNVAQIYAGTRDSPLTSHGVLQASRLGSYLASSNVRISQIFSSDLQRAYKTAESIRLAQALPLTETTKSNLLRERDFGSFEGKAYAERARVSAKKGHDAHVDGLREDPALIDMESKESMRLRMETFIKLHLVELFDKGADDDTVAVVAHGIILSYLWKAILQRFDQQTIQVAPSVMVADPAMGLQFLGGWSNTGYMDLEIKRKAIPTHILGSSTSELQPSTTTPDPQAFRTTPAATKMADSTTLDGVRSMASGRFLDTRDTLALHPPARSHHSCLIVKAVNSREHLLDLKKTRGGIGSLKHDEKQTTMDSFIKKRKIG